MRLKIRGTVSRLWANTSGRDSEHLAQQIGLAEVGGEHLTPVDRFSRLMARTVSAYSQRPPSGGSSRATR